MTSQTKIPQGYKDMTRLAEIIRSHPEEMDMKFWHAEPGGGSRWIDDSVWITAREWPCGTTHCIAGTAQTHLYPDARTTEDILVRLGLTDGTNVDEEDQVFYYMMFYLGTWPKYLRDAYRGCEQDKFKRAEIAAQAVEYYRDHRWPDLAKMEVA